VNGNEFIRKIRRIGSERNVAASVDARRGKGSHRLLYFGNRRVTIKDARKEIGPGLLAKMLRQLGLTKDDF